MVWKIAGTDAHVCPRRRRASGPVGRRIPDCPGTPALSLWLLVLPVGMPRLHQRRGAPAASTVSSTVAGTAGGQASRRGRGGTAQCRGEAEEMRWPHRTEDTIDRARTHHRVKLSDSPEDALVFDGTDETVQHPVDYSGQWDNLYSFLRNFPQVSSEQALAGIRGHVKAEIPAHCNVASRPPHTERGSCRIEVPRFERPSQISPRRKPGHFPEHRFILTALPDP